MWQCYLTFKVDLKSLLSVENFFSVHLLHIGLKDSLSESTESLSTATEETF